MWQWNGVLAADPMPTGMFDCSIKVINDVLLDVVLLHSVVPHAASVWGLVV